MEINLTKTAEETRVAFLALKEPKDIADLLEIPNKTLIYLLYRVPESQRYISFEIPKKGGGKRTINAPNTSIKIIQHKLKSVLYQVYNPKPSVQGFMPKRSIVTNAKKHSKKRFVLNIDLKDFFPSINFGRVRGMFMSGPYNLPDKIATVLAQICCNDNQLPQGAPTSPIVSNMISSRLDTRLQRLAQIYRCTYTRYADDISISTTQNRFPKELAFLDSSTLPPNLIIGKELLKSISENGFQINMRKARLQLPHDRHEVTGITANIFPNVQRRFINQIRAMLHAWEKYGYDNAEKEFLIHYQKKHRNPVKGNPKYIQVLKGKLNYLAMIRGSLDPIFIRYASKLAALDKNYEHVYRYKIQSQIDKTNPHNAIWVLEGKEKQGTGFFLENVGFVTCWHVLEDDLRAFRPQAPPRTYRVENLYSDKDLDLAIIKIETQDPITLPKGDSTSLRIGDTVTLLGFPNYSHGQTVQEFRGSVTGFKENFFGYRRIMIDAPIVSGNSGGPVLNDKNEVIGVAFRGSERLEDQWKNESGCTPIHLIDILKK
jgi:RNA-directed DNA polymerase